MSTRDDDNGASTPNGTGYRFPIRDRRFENVVEDVDDAGDPVDDADDVDVPVDPSPDLSGSNPRPDPDSVRVRSRRRPVEAARSGDSGPEAPTGEAGTPDAPVAPETPGRQVMDTPTSRIRAAAERATRAVKLSDRETRQIDNMRTASPNLIGTVLSSPRVQRGAADTRSTEEFDQQFIEDARRAFGEGFIPQNQLPGDLSDRVRHIVTVSSHYAQEFLLDQLERMVIAKVPVDTIASRFRVSTATVYSWRQLLKKKWAAKIQELKGDQMPAIIGEHMAKFEVRIAMGMAMAQKPNATMQEITKGLEIAERAQTNLIKYQHLLGLHDQKPLANSRDASNADDVHVRAVKGMTNALSELMGGFVGDFPVAGDLDSAMGDDDDDAQVMA